MMEADWFNGVAVGLRVQKTPSPKVWAELYAAELSMEPL
jgi:hypothetical protein